MPLSHILVLTGIVAAFGFFALSLAWAERQTRHLVRADQTHGSQPGEDATFKKAA